MADTSGTYSFNLDGADMALEILERVQIRGPMVSQQVMSSLRRSTNLTQARWASRGVNLWTVNPSEEPDAVPLTQGVGTYNVDASVVMMLDVWLRIYQFDESTNVLPDFEATIHSTTVTIYWPAHGLAAGNWMGVGVPVAIGGIIVSGYYLVQDVTDSDHFTITVPFAAQVSQSGGSVPLYTSTATSPTIRVTLTANGLLAGSQYVAQVSTAVGGVTIFGAYTVASVIDANNFTIINAAPAATDDSASENEGYVQLSGATGQSDPVDRWLSPVSRDDYAAFPNKAQQSPPTVYWFNRQNRTQTVTLWPVPDGAGPYELRYYSVRQLQDTNLVIGESPDVVYRGLEALCAGVAAHMAVKWAPQSLAMLKGEAAEAWDEFAAEDRERVPIYISPSLGSYYDGGQS